jgi:ligand-binding sensor domain-containing protein/signal transduction histidine kinase
VIELSHSRLFPRAFVLLLLLLETPGGVLSEQLPVKNYTIADGLARDYVNRIRQDSHGFMWFCTNEGISRFDGYGFTNYGVADGLPDRVVNDFVETRGGAYLFATNRGVVEFNPATGDSNSPHFAVVTLDQHEGSKWVRKLTADETGAVWCGTANGLYRLDRGTNGWESTWIRPISPHVESLPAVNTLTFDRKGALWIGTDVGLYRLFPDRTIEHYTTQNGLNAKGISQLLLDRDGKMWVGTSDGLTLLVNDPRPNERIAARVYSKKDGLLYPFISALFQSSDGRLWVGTRGGLNVLVDPKNNSGLSFRGYTTAQGLRNVKIWDITEDRDHNLWLGAESGGAMKIPRSGFTSYFETDGLGNGRISQLFSGHDGRLYVVADGVGDSVPFILRFDGHGFVREKPNLPPKTGLTWGWNNLILQDQKGDWWIPTAQGLYRFSGNKSFSELATTKPTKVYTVQDGMASNTVFRLFEDARGDLWFSTLDSLPSVHRWERSSDKIYGYVPAENDIPAAASTAFANDSGGNLWMGFYTGGISRYANGHFTQFTERDGVPPGFVRDMFVDSKKRLWIATNGGLSRVDNPLADRPQFRNYAAADGLATNQVTSVTEDRWGQIYLGTGRGLDRLDPDSGKIKHYTTADGLGDNFINVSMRDSQGALWFGTYRGLSRFTPEQDKPLSSPPIIISGLRVAGARQTISELGETEVTIPELSYRQNQVQIDFLSISYAPGDVLRYQFKLEGSRTDWSAPAEQHTITLANLPSGNYRFLVRAVNSDGTVSVQPAVVTFKILPPFWLRWWFVCSVALLVAATLYSFYRYRTARLREVNAALAEAQRAEEALGRSRTERLAELERVRARIATDLHDDIGSSLTQIAILSEVAHQQTGAGASENGSEPIARIISVSNELVDTMSDIVWAINPKKDHLSDLRQRMRRFASDVFTARQIAFHFRASDSELDIELGANVRREVFLIFKESVNNVVKHSGCTRAEIEFQIEDDWLVLKVTDNGKGFESMPALDDSATVISSARGGNGLPSMRKRAQEMGGEFQIASRIGQGTTATLRVLVAHQQAEMK